MTELLLPPPPSPEQLDFEALLERELGLPPSLGALLARRGVADTDQAKIRLAWERTELEPSILPGGGPRGLAGFDRAVELLMGARERGETVVIHGDYDVDGMTGTAVLWMALRRAGLRAGWTLPRRDGEGYGLSDASLERCRLTDGVFGLPDGTDRTATWVISVDTGVTAGPQIERAKAKGLRTIVTDHHLPGDGWPEAAEVVLNPCGVDSTYENRALCGAAVAWKLGRAILERTGAAAESDPVRLLQLVALGTLADMVPLTPENMALVRLGLCELRDRPLAGVAALLKAAELDPRQRPRAQELVFRVTPRLNSAGRLRKGEVAISLLLASSPEEARAWISSLESLNHERQALDQRITAEALVQAQALCRDGHAPAAFVLSGETWHEGVSGIVAQRVAERYHRPVLVLAPDPGRPGEMRGSGRSARSMNLHQALTHCAHLFEKWGGHSQAAGLSIRVERIEELRETFVARAAIQEATPEDAPIQLEALVRLEEITPSYLGWLERLEPWGNGNEHPVLGADDLEVVAVSRVGDGRHLRASFRQGQTQLDAIGFGLGDSIERLSAGSRVRIAFVPEWNEFRGRRVLQLKLKGIQ